jgi:magnesium transporter
MPSAQRLDVEHDIFETAAAHATRHVPVAEPHDRAGDVRASMTGRRFECASHIVVCDGERFAGLATIEELLSAPEETTLAALMDPQVPVVAPGVDQEVAAWQAVRHGESALAVVDVDGKLVGVIPPHRLVEVLLAEHEEDLSRLGGFLKTSSTARTTSEEPVIRRFRHRLPWLLVGLGGALLAADLVSRFEQVLRFNVMLAFFMPGIVYLADAVGTQTETVVVRGLSLGVPFRLMVAREVAAGVMIGATLGAISAPLVLWQWGDFGLALTVGASVFAAASTSTIVAMLLPWTFDGFSLDPAFGSGPLGTVIQDLLSIWIYLSVATLIG